VLVPLPITVIITAMDMFMDQTVIIHMVTVTQRINQII